MTNKIGKIHFNIQNAELADFAPKLYSWYAASAAAGDVILKPMMSKEKESGDALLTAFKRQKIVSGLDEADKARDEATVSLYAVVDGYARFPLAEKKSAAVQLLTVLDKYRGLTRQSLNKQSTETMSLLEDLAKDEFASSIKALDGVADLIAKVSAAQAAFRAEEARLVESKAGAGDNATTLRKKLFSLINDDIIPYLNIAAKYGDEGYAELARKVAAEVDATNLKVTQRLASGK